MKNGIPEKSDADTLMDIYKKLNIDGTLNRPITTDEQVLIFCLAKWARESLRD